MNEFGYIGVFLLIALEKYPHELRGVYFADRLRLIDLKYRIGLHRRRRRSFMGNHCGVHGGLPENHLIALGVLVEIYLMLRKRKNA